MEPSTDLLQLSVEEIKRQLEDNLIRLRNAEVATSQSVSQMNIKNVAVKTPSTMLYPSDGHAVEEKTGDETQAHTLEQGAKQLEDNIQVGNGEELATSQSAGQTNVENVGIKALQPSYAQAVSKKEKTNPTQPLFLRKIANVQLDDNSQFGNAGVLISKSASQMKVANRRVANKFRSVRNVQIAASPSEKPDITDSAKDPPTSSIRSLEIGKSQQEDEINAKNQGELPTLESKGALLEKNKEMKKSRNIKAKNLNLYKNGGRQASSSLTEEFEKQLEGHNVNVRNAGLSQPTSQTNLENLRIATLQAEGHVTEENAEITTPLLERPGIIESAVESSPTSSSIKNLEVGPSLLSKNVYWAIANSDEINARNQGAATSESKVEFAQLEIKQRRKKSKKNKKRGSGEGPPGINFPSNQCFSKEIIVIFTVTIVTYGLWLLLVKGAHVEPRGSSPFGKS